MKILTTRHSPHLMVSQLGTQLRNLVQHTATLTLRITIIFRGRHGNPQPGLDTSGRLGHIFSHVPRGRGRGFLEGGEHVGHCFVGGCRWGFVVAGAGRNGVGGGGLIVVVGEEAGVAAHLIDRPGEDE